MSLDAIEDSLCFARNGRWGTCADCPRDQHGLAYPERCEHTDRYDHHIDRAPTYGFISSILALGDPTSLRGLDTLTRVRFYEHDFYPLSNFSAFSLMWKGLRFDTSEAAYHFEKFAGMSVIQERIRCAPSAHEAFKLAHAYRYSRRPDWDDVKVQVMREILCAKAVQHEYVRRKLIATGDRELVEDSWRDDFWGWGPNRDGQNMLGKLWMELRAALRAAGLP